MMENRLHRIYQHDPEIVSRSIAGDTILVPIRKNLGEMESIYSLNETGARIWELIDGQRPLTEVHQVMIHEFDVDPVQAEQDLLELIDDLLEQSALVQINI